MLSETQIAGGGINERICSELIGSMGVHLKKVVCVAFSHCKDHVKAGFGDIAFPGSIVWMEARAPWHRI